VVRGDLEVTPLRVIPVGGSDTSARLDAFFYAGEQPDRSLWFGKGGEYFKVRSKVARRSGVRVRTRIRSVWTGKGWRKLDQQLFELHEDRFVELPLAEHGFDGPLVLPAELRVGEPHRPHPTDPRTVTLRYVGPIRLVLGSQVEERIGMALQLAGPGGAPWEQWLVEGVGEVALGPADQAPHRWLVGWRGDGMEALFPGLDQAGQAAR
jgi:hypothetical protein